MSEPTPDPACLPATAPLRGPRGSLLYSGSDGNQYIVAGGPAHPGDAPLAQAFQALRAGAPELDLLSHRCRQWVEAAGSHGLTQPQAAAVLLGQLALALDLGEEGRPLLP
ncbi:hypothetical protein KQ313_03335 [Synechococcus sp. CS-1325]|uniref:hypothetical protein n=1 Tax=unclassified Synechococcus TaxID=2626047 RepID=UPI000DB5094F|nr:MULTISPECIES: hypothetical protein [unclassified Synechococcus]PZV02084.1 MAG: hypothetical protein DCF24_02440 [Cyanobium sp.]MCT0198719.1 hypothetical protein [Synechococcus sp. CS-1325]MCT0212940.1 hypothetical protein [Synechococcus sp. CS-1326]MCT0231520.1 hypothetical protein [Synechococcus sp. CS-1324]MCT0233144.1 hypothetical protein [Synechococcus sp. CS-1327]